MSNHVQPGALLGASHSRSWDTASGPQLNAQLEGWLSQVQSTKRPAITAPHAGHTYCGSVGYPGKEGTRAMSSIDRA
uniref:Uncharacterized protein n=1 Tax=Strix occidentalis caurina TaxID=311401 RepID=A0A8D0KWH3_STROC